MATAAFLVSVLALVISGVSVAYTRLQGVETRRLRQIEAARRHEEQAPVLSGEVESVSDGAWYRLWLTLHSQTSLDRLDLRIVEGDGIAFTTGQYGVAPMAAHPRDASYDRPEPLAQGERCAWQVDFDPHTGPSRMRLRVTCQGRDDTSRRVVWDVLVNVESLPIDLSRTFG